MRAKKEIKHNLYKCSIIDAQIELQYEIYTSPDREKLIHFGCADCTKCGVGTQMSAWETKVDWVKCTHPLSPKP